MYFEVYSVADALKTRFAALNFIGAAATWLQTFERRGRVLDWTQFCSAVFEKFDKDQYQNQLRQLENLSQQGSVSEYQEQFERLAHGILLYNSSYDDTYFVTRFLGGLKEEIRVPISLHRPKEVQSALALALLQEEALESVRRSSKLPIRSMAPVDRLKSSGPDQNVVVKTKSDRPESEDKLQALKTYRRKNGLCFKCGEKWGQNHKCPNQVPIHVVEELLDAVDLDEMNGADELEEETEVAAVMSVRDAGLSKRKTMRLQGYIGKESVLILVDSGSVGTFVSKELAARLPYAQLPCEEAQFTAADGSLMACSRRIPQLKWTTQGHTFVVNAGILPLQCYDMILGEDWLQACSPMWVHWGKKIMRFTYNTQRVTLRGVRPQLTQCRAISAGKLKVPASASYQGVSSIDLEPEHDDASIPVEIQNVLDQFPEVFQVPTSVPPNRPYDHHIPLLPGAQPVNVRPYRYTPTQKSEIEKQLTEMLKNGIIRPSTSPYASPMLLVKKKDGTWRFCVDYRHLNMITVKNKHPIPVVDELIDELAGAQWFTKLDLRSGYHQICLAPGEEHKTAFKTHSGLYEFLVMPFGLTNAPATFQSAMNQIFEPLLRKGVLVFMDDILVYSNTMEEHVTLLTQVFYILQKSQFYVKLSKCSFAKQTIDYLGHCISSVGVSTEPSKILAVKYWPTPVNLKQLRGFLDLTGYYRKFIRHYGLFSRPLTLLLKKGVPFVWTPVTEEAFQLLKTALIEAPVLAIPDFSKSFVLETDACDTGLGAVLMQDNHPVAYLSKALSPKNLGLSTYEKECLAILLAVEKWRPYLQHQEFIIRTDHRSLLYLTEHRVATKIQQKALLKLMDLQFKISYKQGISNAAADALSRCPVTEAICAISSCTPTWIENLIQGYEEDDLSKQLLTELALSPSNEKGYTLDQGVLRYKGRVWIGNNSLAQRHVIQALHASGIGGHSGFQATYRRIKNLFAWPKLKATVKTYVSECAICQQAKSEHVKYPGLLQPLPVPSQAWTVVSMDFIEGLPSSNRFNAILVVVDKFIKYAHFIPLAHPFTALQVAQLYMQHVYKLHGLPQSIISDRDRIFTSNVWQELFRLTDTQLLMSSSYHPQTDGQTERLNQCLEAFLRCAVHSCPHQWSKWLSLAEFWYNTSYQSSLGRSPFEVLYGHPPRHFGISNLTEGAVPDLEAWLTERNLLTRLIQQQLMRAQQRMKHQADKNRSEREFQVDDLVYLKLQPYIQTSVANRTNQKLSFRFFGPFKVLQRIGSVAYKLDLPPDCKIHPVVHVSQLKKHVPPSIQIEPDLSSLPGDPTVQLQPVAVIGRRVITHGSSPTSELLIQWSALPSSMTTWEQEEDVIRRFPYSAAWGQADFRGGGSVRTLEGQ
ncbi:hypothetical protein U9M48_027033 [Paspalum notatum var. saurae]|uniref:Uncharacterized protein n=1 Tax=Paspalum notatum var. saurae TaxID=547442 RepID=A0AAQ3TYM7_PASNO